MPFAKNIVVAEQHGGFAIPCIEEGILITVLPEHAGGHAIIAVLGNRNFVGCITVIQHFTVGFTATRTEGSNNDRAS